MKQLETRKEEIRQIFKEADQIALKSFQDLQDGQSLSIEEKSPKELVSSVDKELSEFLVDSFGALGFENVFSEEKNFESFHGERSSKVLVDPLDGTHNFVFGLPMWAITASFFDEDEKISGAVISLPTEEKLLFIGKELELYVRGQKVSYPFDSSKQDALKKSMVFYDNQVHKIGAKDFFKRFEKLVMSSFTTRIGGSASWDIFKVATSKVAARVFGAAELYDIAPAIALSELHGFSLQELSHKGAFVFGQKRSVTSEIRDLLC